MTGATETALDDVDRAAAIAISSRDQVFGRNFYDLLVARIPRSDTAARQELVARLKLRDLRARVAKLRSPAALGRWLRCEAGEDQVVAVAWGLSNVIGQIEECRQTGGDESPVTRFRDVIAHPHPVQICLFGLDYLIFCYES